MSTVFCCPVCGRPLSDEPKRFVCPRGHSFDRSAGGYVNLLLRADGGGHGDNRAMVAARRAFLEGGWYAPLLDAVAEALSPVLSRGGALLDAGCGEGWYTDRLLARFPAARGYGVDVSRDAVRYACRRPSAKEGRLQAAVASCYRLPVADGAADALTQLFSVMATEEYRRVLRPGGLMVLAVPDADHLMGLKEILYERPYPNERGEDTLPGFTLTGERSVRFTLTLDDPAIIRALFEMTPYAYRTGAAGRAALEATRRLSTPAAFRVLTYRCDKPSDRPTDQPK